MRQTQAKGKTFPTDTAVDFVIIGRSYHPKGGFCSYVCSYPITFQPT